MNRPLDKQGSIATWGVHAVHGMHDVYSACIPRYVGFYALLDSPGDGEKLSEKGA